MAPDIPSPTGETLSSDSPVSLPEYQAPEIDLAEVTPVELLHESDDSRVFRGRWREKDCVLKIVRFESSLEEPSLIWMQCHFSEEPSFFKEYETDPFLRESQAYCRLKAFGLCEKGHIPDFYGLIKNIVLKTQGWEPHLEVFAEDPELPNALVIEFFPNLRPFELSTYSANRADQLRATVVEIHKAGVWHGDIEKRNTKVQEETNRVILIDFDRAVTLPLDSRTETEKDIRGKMANEEVLLLETLAELAEDHKRGKIWSSWYWHYGLWNLPNWTKEDLAAVDVAVRAAAEGTLAAESPLLVHVERPCQDLSYVEWTVSSSDEKDDSPLNW
ncbi:hypothetical protein PMG11_00742 [Penicillium brasilianum]|uniref:Protein kinase domain-containing protein n=1 Tax=Penicillium brasilianum TaxID=104259 RepID=A0A0F7TCL6_PENBI|nr:hypothetical protein PMG11_00742 [Penicillium brasilianum]